jgi:hypothetical protein
LLKERILFVLLFTLTLVLIRKRNTRKNIIDSGYSRKIIIRKSIFLLILLIILIYLLIRQTTAYDMLYILREQFDLINLVKENEIII